MAQQSGHGQPFQGVSGSFGTVRADTRVMGLQKTIRSALHIPQGKWDTLGQSLELVQKSQNLPKLMSCGVIYD